MKTFQIITLFALIAASMAFSPNQAGKYQTAWIGSDSNHPQESRASGRWEVVTTKSSTSLESPIGRSVMFFLQQETCWSLGDSRFDIGFDFMSI